MSSRNSYRTRFRKNQKFLPLVLFLSAIFSFGFYYFVNNIDDFSGVIESDSEYSRDHIRFAFESNRNEEVEGRYEYSTN